MPHAYRVWYISDFYEEISKEIKHQNPNDSFSIHMNTVDNWFKRMEKEKIHFTHRDNFQRRIYDDTDLKIACFLYKETKVDKTPIGTVFKFKFNEIKTRSYDDAQKNIFQTNKETANIFKFLPEKSIEGSYSSSTEIKEKINSKPKKLPIELTEILKMEVTFNGKKLTLNEKQRIRDFLSGLVWPKSTL